jgi:diphosphomevalonate decarboxylase
MVRFTNIYKQEAKKFEMNPFSGEKKTSWRSPSNIALVKYWGKHGIQLPQNPSISFGLKNSFSETTVTYSYSPSGKMKLVFLFESKPNEAFAKRIRQFLESITNILPFLNNLNLKIESSNSFPHSSGIASSASAMSALALCLVSIEKELFDTIKNEKEFFEKASYLARLGSGSAARSIYPGYVVWGESSLDCKYSNEMAVELDREIHKAFLSMGDAILITSSEKKKVSSSAGHGLMENHPFAKARYEQAGKNLEKLIQSLEKGDEEKFIEVLENEALSLHSLMMSSNPGFTLLNSSTWQIIEKVKQFRIAKNLMLTFTLDAGPNVHLIYKSKDKAEITTFVASELVQFCENGYWIDDQMGSGPEKLI